MIDKDEALKVITDRIREIREEFSDVDSSESNVQAYALLYSLDVLQELKEGMDEIEEEEETEEDNDSDEY